jgi:galactose mutarotase-like enzyme
MNVILQNQFIKAGFSTRGAELQELQFLNNRTNYLWSGNKNVWGKYSPILFPIVGALREGKYIYQDKTYQLPRHGFARDLDFLVTQQSDCKCVFELRANEQSRNIYPFDFVLQISYELHDYVLICCYQVVNPSASKDLYFSLGAHPAFSVPLFANENYNDYFLHFLDDSQLISYTVSDNLLSDERVTINLPDGNLGLTYELFNHDALILKSIDSEQISIRSKTHSHGLDFSFNGFDFFGIWAAPKGDFVCLEPWSGIADSQHHNQQLTEKEGIICLKPLDNWQAKWQVKLY